MLRFRYHLYRSNAPHRGGDFIIIQMNQLHKDKYCEIDIKEFLEKYDGIEKIKQTAQYVGDIISKEWPEIDIFVDCTVDMDE